MPAPLDTDRPNAANGVRAQDGSPVTDSETTASVASYVVDKKDKKDVGELADATGSDTGTVENGNGSTKEKKKERGLTAGDAGEYTSSASALCCRRRGGET